MMTREPDDGWDYDDWLTTPKEQRASWPSGLRLFLLCVALAASSVAVTMIPG